MKAFDKRLLLKVIFSVIPFLLLVYFVQKQIRSTIQFQEAQKQALEIKSQKGIQSIPVRLKIPSIKVDAAVEYVGLTSEKAMGVPKDIENVGWFYVGTSPGELGSAVISGHFNGTSGEAGVFANLYKLKKGDQIYIEDDKETSIAFVVREIRIYDSEYADEVFTPKDKAYLNLITCDGVWNAAKNSYNKRLVVFSDIVN